MDGHGLAVARRFLQGDVWRKLFYKINFYFQGHYLYFAGPQLIPKKIGQVGDQLAGMFLFRWHRGADGIKGVVQKITGLVFIWCWHRAVSDAMLEGHLCRKQR